MTDSEHFEGMHSALARLPAMPHCITTNFRLLYDGVFVCAALHLYPLLLVH